MMNNSKFLEGALTRMDDRRLWIYEISSVTFNPDDSIEYWYYVEHYGLGYFSDQMNVNVRDLSMNEMERLIMMAETKNNPTFLTRSYTPKVNVKLMGSNAIQFSIEENAERINDAWIYINPLNKKNSKMIERKLVKDDENGIWHYVYRDKDDSISSSNDEIEYWVYVEKYGVGYYSTDTISINDIIDTRGNFEVDIFDLIDVRGDLPDSVRMNQIRNFPTQQQTSYPKTFAKFSTPKGLEFRVEEKPGDVLNNVKIFIFSPKHIIKSDKFIESHLTRDANGVWICSLPDVALNLDDNIEYWIYAEKSNLGYFTNHISAVQDIAPSWSEVRATTSTIPIFTTSTTPIPIITTTQQQPLSTPAPLKCESAVSTVNGKTVGCKNSIIFNEDFNSDNLKYWSFDSRFPLDDTTSDAEFTVYEKRTETSFIRDNMMIIRAESLKRVSGFDDTRIRLGNLKLNEKCTPLVGDERECERQANYGYILPPVTSAYLSTRNKFSFMYGRVEARVRGPIGDYLYAQITLQPQSDESASNMSSKHMKVMFMRGNEHLRDGIEDVGGNRVYGGVILSKNPKNNLKWLKSKHFPNSHLGSDFHIYELLWTPSEISLSIDGIKYGSLDSNLRESAMGAKIKSAVNWSSNGPFDKEHFIAINMAAGGVKNFFSLNATLLNGVGLEAKFWNDTDPRAERSFYMSHDKWYTTWRRPFLEVDYVKIYSV